MIIYYTRNGKKIHRKASNNMRRSPQDRFFTFVKKTPGCWLWTGALKENGYGAFGVNYRSGYAHRFSYENFRGPIPHGLTIDHLCRVRNCVNPSHLEAVTIGVNTLRGNSVSAKCARKTHCPNGHPYDGVNTYRCRRRRQCRICRIEYGKKW